MSVNLTDTVDSAPLHVSSECGHLEVTKVFVVRGAAINYIDKYCDTPHMVDANNSKFEILWYLIRKRRGY